MKCGQLQEADGGVSFKCLTPILCLAIIIAEQL